MTYPDSYREYVPLPTPPKPPRRHRVWPWVLVGLVALIVALVATGAHLGSPQTQIGTPTSASPTAAGPAFAAPQVAAVSPTTEAPAVDPQVRQATEAAQEYLNVMPFSRAGLIQQLDSSAGDGYPVSVATAAVDSLTVDYDAQAAKAAQQYLNTMPFSCSGLIQQLSASAGDKYTSAQASYGAHQTSACG